MKRQHDGVADPSDAPHFKVPRTVPAPQGPVKQRRAVPPGYLHDLLHSRHMMKTVGLRVHNGAQPGASKLGPSSVAVTSGRIAALAKPQHPLSKATAMRTHTLPSLFEHRKRFLQTKRRKERGQTPYQQHPDKPVGLLSLPEDVLVSSLVRLRRAERCLLACLT